MAVISPHELHQLRESDPGLTLIDVRTRPEYAEVHVPGARNVPLDEIGALSDVSRDRPVYLLCHTGNRAAKAAERLAKEGFTRTRVVEGGTVAWEAAGFSVLRGRSGVISLERQVRIVAGTLVFTGVALGVFVHPGFLALPAFVGAGLVFAGITDFCGMGLLLARMPWNK